MNLGVVVMRGSGSMRRQPALAAAGQRSPIAAEWATSDRHQLVQQTRVPSYLHQAALRGAGFSRWRVS